MRSRCGLVAVVGAPNAGKSTLVNALVGQKVAIVSPKAQTTRTRLMGIAIEGEAQILLLDTPGIFAPQAAARPGDGRRRLGRRAGCRSDRARWSMPRPASPAASSDLLDRLKERREPKMLVLNKVDLVAKEKLLTPRRPVRRAGRRSRRSSWSPRPPATASPTSRRRSPRACPKGPWHFPEDQVSDASDRMLAAEVTREQLYRQLHAELPYASAVETEKYEERKDGSVAIHQQILVARDSQKAIVLGKGGTRIRAIGEAARQEIGAAARPQGPPLPPRQGQPEMGGGSRPLPRDRARLGGVKPPVIASGAKMSRSPCPRHGFGLRGRPNLLIQCVCGGPLDCRVAPLLAMTSSARCHFQGRRLRGASPTSSRRRRAGAAGAPRLRGRTGGD